ncbi:MAG TPA: M20/M25/M40 family metallo-hydrolase [Conexibacter sp.]|nr:M20/M25/M40 family metallo-hydrolase [Conexibacter sp.]
MSALSTDSIRARVRAALPAALAALERLIAIPSVSNPAWPREQCVRCAEAIAAAALAAGFKRAELLADDGAPPALVAHRAGHASAPLVVLYAHYDVMPPGPPEGWTTPAFEPAVRDGRLYGRGSADDKGAIAAHLAAVAALADAEAPSLLLFVEGAEELGSPCAMALLERALDGRRPDAIVVPDADALSVERPYLTLSLRGLVECDVELRTLAAPVHDGLFGGVVPDAALALARLLATLTDADGSPAIAGLVRDPLPDGWLEPTAAELLAGAGALPGVGALGCGPVARTLWRTPALAVYALERSGSEDGSQLTPAARARIGLRTAPSQDAVEAARALERHLRAHVPWGAELDVRTVSAMPGVDLAAGGGSVLPIAAQALADAWGAPLERIGSGAAIPIVEEVVRAYPDVSVVLSAIADVDCSAHGPDESVSLGLLERLAVAQALLLHRLAADAASD